MTPPQDLDQAYARLRAWRRAGYSPAQVAGVMSKKAKRRIPTHVVKKMMDQAEAKRRKVP